MAQRTELEVAPRIVMGKATRHLRREGLIPANIYGHKEASQAVQIKVADFDRLRRAHSTRHLLNLKLPRGKTLTALIRHIQQDPINGKIVHVDFGRVSLSERVTVKVPLHFVGEAPGVKNAGGVLLTMLEALEVECRASDIVDAIEVDISPLVEIDSLLHASSVVLPRDYTLITSAEEAIAKVASTRATIEETTAEAAPAAETPQAAPVSPAE